MRRIVAVVGACCAAALAAWEGIGGRTAAGTAGAWPRQLCPGEEIPVDLGPRGLPFVHMRLGNVSGAFLLDTGTTFTAVAASAVGLPAGAATDLRGSTFPTLAGVRGARAATFGTTPSPGAMAGILGTDVLGTRTVELRYDGPTPYAVVSDRPCDPAAMAASGFVAVPQAGWFGPGGGRPAGTPDIPVVWLRLGATMAPAWLDTGFGEGTVDPPPGVVRANPPLGAELAAGGGLAAAGAVTATDCTGGSRRTTLRRPSGEAAFVGPDGRPIGPGWAATVQEAPPDGCGGPGTVGRPLGLVGAAWPLRWGAVVIDPLGGSVWLPGVWRGSGGGGVPPLGKGRPS